MVVANKKYNHLDNDYEIIIVENSTVNIRQNSGMVSVQPSFNFHPLASLNSLVIDNLYGRQFSSKVSANFERCC